MNLTVKLLLITALVLSIIIPFGYFLIGEKTKKRSSILVRLLLQEL